MNTTNDYIFLGIHSDLEQTDVFLFNEKGEGLARSNFPGSCLFTYPDAATRVLKSMEKCAGKLDMALEDIDAFGLALAGADDEDARDRVFRLLDQQNISQRSIICSPVEALADVAALGNNVLVLHAGAHIQFLARKGKDSKFIHGFGDAPKGRGSAYWLGHQAMLHIASNDVNIAEDPELEAILEMLLSTCEVEDFNDLNDDWFANRENLKKIAASGEQIVRLAENDNDVALQILQEGTMAIAENLLEVLEELNLSDRPQFLASGNLMQGIFYRRQVNDALHWDFPKIAWAFSSISPAFGAARMAARLQEVEVAVKDIVQHST